ACNRARELRDRLGPVGAADEAAAGRGLGPGLPLQIVGVNRLTQPDVALRNENINSRQLGNRRNRRLAVRSADEIGGDAASHQGDSQNDDTRELHDTSLIYAGRSAAVYRVSQLSVKARLRRRIQMDQSSDGLAIGSGRTGDHQWRNGKASWPTISEGIAASSLP